MAEIQAVKMIFPADGLTEDGALVTRLGPSRYRLESSPLTEVARFGDVVEVAAQEDGALVFQRVVSPSVFRTYDYVLSREAIESPRFKELVERVTESGGQWEVAYGGCVMIHVPPDVGFDPAGEIEAITDKDLQVSCDAALVSASRSGDRGDGQGHSQG
jgi:hypothetical protein